MPLYEYICLSCDQHFEVLRSMKDADASIKCIRCSKENVKRAISVFNAISNGKSITHSQTSCSGCSSGNCSSCGN